MTALRWFVAGPGASDDAAAPSSQGRARHPHAVTSSSAIDPRVAAVQGGDESALDALAREYAPALCEFAATFVRDADVAEDIVQDVFLHVWINRATWDVHGSVRGYLFGAVRNEALRRVRHDRVVHRTGDTFLRALESPATGTAPARADEHLEAGELDRALAAAVLGLKRQQQELLVLRVRHGLTPAEIASITGMSPGAVRTALSRVRDLLRPVLDRFQ